MEIYIRWIEGIKSIIRHKGTDESERKYLI